MATLSSSDVKLLQTALGVTVDGKLGPVTIKAMQTKLGVAVDGKLGPVTISALQRRLGAQPVDGKIGPITIAAIRNYAPALAKDTFVVPYGTAPSIGTLRFDLKKLAVAGFGVAAAALFALAVRSGKRYA